MSGDTEISELDLSSEVASIPSGQEIPLSAVINELMGYVFKKESVSATPAETAIIYRAHKIVDVSLTKYPDQETARLGVRDKLKEFEPHVKNVAGVKAIMEIKKEPHILVGSSDALVIILFKSRPEWRATTIANWLRALADTLSKTRIIPDPPFLTEVLRYIIRGQNKHRPDSYNKLIMEMILRADKIYPMMRGGPGMVRASLKAIGIKLGEHVASLGEAIVNEGLLTGDRSLIEIAEEMKAKLVDVIRLMIELEARGIVSF